MFKKILAGLICLVIPALVGGQPNKQLNSPFQSTNTNPAGQAAMETPDPAITFVDSARQMIVEQKFSQARESLRTALRIAPMDLEIWALYDEVVNSDYVERKRREKFNPVIEGDIKPIFSINRIDSYIELGTLYVVGTLQNVSQDVRQNIVLTGKILDENKRELRRETGTLLIPERGLMPNESSLFEIPFKNFPPGGKSFRVEVTAYE